jgi:phenylacetate-CoA ligase
MVIARVFWDFLQLQHNQWLPKEALEKIQLKKLKTILAFAYNNVPFFKRFYDQHGAHPSKLRTLDDIRKFPIITKELARDVPLEERTAVGADVSRCTLRTTSGSTGIPVTILEDKRSQDYSDAYFLRRFFEYDFKPWMKTVRLINEPISKPKSTGDARSELLKKFLRNRFKGLAISEDIKNSLKLIEEENPDFIVSAPSYLNVIAKEANELGITSIRPKAIVSCSEILNEANRNFLSSSFNSPIYDGYGCIEIAPLGMAWECRERLGLHVNMDVVFLEFLKDGEQVSPGEKGEVVATSLFRFATPMVRYKVGDIVTLSDEECTCGREMPLIKNIEGKTVDFLKMVDGRMISPYAVISSIQYIQGIAQFQVVQKKLGKIVINIEKSKKFSQNTIVQVKSVCIELFGYDMEIEINIVEDFPIKRGKKFRLVQSLVQ